MADTDNSSPILRYNLITQGVEYFQGSDFYPIALTPSSGVSSLNTLTGDVVLAAGSNITLTPSGNTITIAATGGGGGTPAGSNTQVQYNNAGSFGADANFTWDGSTLAINGAVQTTGINYPATNVAIDLNNGFLRDIAGTLAMRFGTERVLDDNTQTESLDWQNRQMTDNGGTLSVDWQNRFLGNVGNGNDLLDWNTNQLIKINGSLGVNLSGSQDNSAIMEADSTTRGFLPPRMTTTQKNAISSPAEGLVIYDTTLHKLCVRTAAAWETITSA